MITADPTQPAQSATDPSPFTEAATPGTQAETTAAPAMPALPATANPSGCPACTYPIRRAYAGELICPNCGNREPLPAAIRSRLLAAWPGRGSWGRVGGKDEG